jgi:hypothetical protein
MRPSSAFCMAAMAGLAMTFAQGCTCERPSRPHPARGQWRGLHLTAYGSDADLEALAVQLPVLAGMGVNVLILEVNYNFDFQSHPELRAGDHPITRDGAGRFAKACRRAGVRLIPQFNCLGHQSWSNRTFPLLTRYPDLDLTPGAFPDNKGLYCREWDPLNPKVNQIVLPLLDELIDAFEADAMHVGMDEVFLIGSDQSPSTRGKDPAVVFAKAVNDLHSHLVGKRRVQMLMWGDRLIDGKAYPYGKWESSENGTARAVDMIPKDIILCDWHYELRPSYPSVALFAGKGFQVLPAGWNKVEPTKAFIQYSRGLNHPKVLGHLFTTWSGKKEWSQWPPLAEGLPLLTQKK